MRGGQTRSAHHTPTPPRGGGEGASTKLDPTTRSMALHAARSNRAATPPRGAALPAVMAGRRAPPRLDAAAVAVAHAPPALGCRAPPALVGRAPPSL